MRRLVAIAALAVACGVAAAHAQSEAPMLFPADQFGQPNKSFSQSSGYTPSQIEVLMGKTDVFEPVYDLSEQDAYRQAGKAVGMLDLFVQTPSGAFGNATCTATVLSNQYILTNYHCVPGKEFKTIKAQLRLGFLDRSRAVGTAFNVTLPPVEADSALDYAILRVDGNPASAFGALKFRTSAAFPRESLVLLHHPAGQPQKLTRFRCVSGDPLMQGVSLIHRCDTLPGSSGALVLAANDLSIVGLHFAGVPDPVNPFNEALPIATLIAKSPILRALANQNRDVVQQASVQRPAPPPAAPAQREATSATPIMAVQPPPQMPAETMQFCRNIEQLNQTLASGKTPAPQFGKTYDRVFIGTNLLGRGAKPAYALAEATNDGWYADFIFDGVQKSEVQTWLISCFQLWRSEYDSRGKSGAFDLGSSSGVFVGATFGVEVEAGNPTNTFVAAEQRYVSGAVVHVERFKRAQ